MVKKCTPNVLECICRFMIFFTLLVWNDCGFFALPKQQKRCSSFTITISTKQRSIGTDSYSSFVFFQGGDSCNLSNHSHHLRQNSDDANLTVVVFLLPVCNRRG